MAAFPIRNQNVAAMAAMASFYDFDNPRSNLGLWFTQPLQIEGSRALFVRSHPSSLWVQHSQIDCHGWAVN
jgi:hypothetical protein